MYISPWFSVSRLECAHSQLSVNELAAAAAAAAALVMTTPKYKSLINRRVPSENYTLQTDEMLFFLFNDDNEKYFQFRMHSSNFNVEI